MRWGCKLVRNASNTYSKLVRNASTTYCKLVRMLAPRTVNLSEMLAPRTVNAFTTECSDFVQHFLRVASVSRVAAIHSGTNVVEAVAQFVDALSYKRVRLPMGSLGFSFDLIQPAALWHCDRLGF
jgi:hypothetical protein